MFLRLYVIRYVVTFLRFLRFINSIIKHKKLQIVENCIQMLDIVYETVLKHIKTY